MVRVYNISKFSMVLNNNCFKSIIICFFLLVFTSHNVFAQKTKAPVKGTNAQKAKSVENKKSAVVDKESASSEVIAFIKKTDFYDLTKEIDISYLENKPAGTGVLFEFHGPQSINCHQKLDA